MHLRALNRVLRQTAMGGVIPPWMGVPESLPEEETFKPSLKDEKGPTT